jgi:leucyl-tRNA synthetase
MKSEKEQYILTMFPYPSGNGLHLGHYYNYAIMDSYSRWQRYNGTKVFQPFGFDSFGLPAENYAKKVGREVSEVTTENIENFKRQMEDMNTKYETLLTTSDPSYYKWTQWLFIKLLEKGLAYKKDAPVNYCPSCETALANAQVQDDKCERCGTEVEDKVMNQWFFKITDYKDRLIENLDWIDYPEKTKKQQRHWLENLTDWCVSRQRKWGCPIPIEGEKDTLDTFVCSSFYYLRYCDPTNEDELVSRSKVKQVDLYVGGSEHACMHLIYARFINMFLYDLEVTPHEEPFKKLVHQGMITMGGEKMSKSKGNIVNPDDYDPDEMRLYLMFLGHYFDGGAWDDSKIKGIRRFINRFRIWMNNSQENGQSIPLSEFNKKVDSFTNSFKFNKVLSTFMEFYNKNKKVVIDTETKEELTSIFKVFAPNFKL